MKKRYILLLFAFIAIRTQSAVGQPCVPDPNLTWNGISPETLPEAMAGYLYWTTLNFKIPKDSVIRENNFNIPVTIDSAKFLFATGRPAGFNFTCNTQGCVWKGGEKGCALFTGKVDSLFVADSLPYRDFPMKIYTQTWFRLTGDVNQLSRIDSATNYVFRIKKYNGIAEFVQYQTLSAYPNPTTGNVTIELRNIENQVNEVSVTDVFGKLIFRESFAKPNHFLTSYNVDLSNYGKGLYFVTLKSGDKMGLSKVMVK